MFDRYALLYALFELNHMDEQREQQVKTKSLKKKKKSGNRIHSIMRIYFSPEVLHQEKRCHYQAQMPTVQQPLVTLLLSAFHLMMRLLSQEEQGSGFFWR